jgi:glycolate oxidase FAD binding subunit
MTSGVDDRLAGLQELLGDAAREAGPEDTVDGTAARYVVEPRSVDEVGRVLALTHEAGLTVSVRGGGTKLWWGNPPRNVDIILSTARLNRILEHAAGDLVVRAEAGTALERLQAAVAGAGQRLALDPPERGATLGGIVAANASGPLRLRYGTARDLLIGVTYVLADGTIARSGGKVVKNVAGYDLGKLFTGSLGTLAVLAELIFRLHPLPAARRLVSAEISSPERAGEATQAILNSWLVPSALELEWESGRGRLTALIEGIEPGVEAQSQTATELLAPYGDVAIAAAPSELARWEHATGDAELKLTFPLADLPYVLDDVEEVAQREGVSTRLRSHAGNGVAYLLLRGDEDALVRSIEGIRQRAERRGGSATVLRAPASIKQRVDVWGDFGNALELMSRVKASFDPAETLNPGRFVGGL